MEELEVLQKAKTYMDKLANGVNPLNDQPVSEEDIVNNVRLSRCFFYVSDVLRRVIENGGVEQKPKRRKSVFNISEEALSNFEYSDTPIPITVFVGRINNLINQREMKKLSYRAVSKWLKEAGLLEDANGRYAAAKTCPSELGKQIGILIEKRINSRGEYFVTYYNRNAQEFIINHLQQITEEA
ncbi:MAG: hypothetical protein IJB97_04275 [Clostridia bacterium]|nr:hypothetical protein [Clostridia bacterium]